MEQTTDVDLLRIRLVRCDSGGYNRKIAFENLNEIMEKRGWAIPSAQTAVDGKGTTIAVRVFDNSPLEKLDVMVPVRLKITSHTEKKPDFNYQIAFIGLIESLRKHGYEIIRAERRTSGRGSDIAIRVRLEEI
jgi:hypothetical protein